MQSVDVIAESTLSTNLEMEEAVVVSSNETNTFEIAQFSAKDRFFEVMEDHVSIYDNSTGTLQVVGYLNKGQEFPRVADYGPDWHQIKYRNGYGYIWKPSTKPSNGSRIHNINPNLQDPIFPLRQRINCLFMIIALAALFRLPHCTKIQSILLLEIMGIGTKLMYPDELALFISQRRFEPLKQAIVILSQGKMQRFTIIVLVH